MRLGGCKEMESQGRKCGLEYIGMIGEVKINENRVDIINYKV
jgi:hypothetical protein